MRKTVIVLLTIMTRLSMYGVPARRQISSITMRDGTTVQATLVGDEHGHWMLAADGRGIRRAADGMMDFMTDDELARCKASHDSRMRTSNTRRHQRLQKARDAAAKVSAAKVSAAKAARASVSASAMKAPVYSGTKKGLVILVNFKDKSFTAGTSTVFNNMFNKEGYNSNYHVGSVRDYFYDQSYGQLSIDFDVVGPVTVSQNMSYYGSNDSDGNDIFPAKMVSEALALIDGNVNFADYDWDGDGEVDQVFVIYAGYGENYGGSDGSLDNTIWPHEWDLYSAGEGMKKYDGVIVNTYACAQELAGSSGKTLCGIGTACHEFSHCLGYPDFYDSSYNGGAGMLEWDLLCSGSYNGYNYNGEQPAGFTAYERMAAGWLEPIELSEPCFVRDMEALSSDNPTTYIIYNDADQNEFYLLENHQQSKWNYFYRGNYLGNGMLIVHVDYDEQAWYNNEVNSSATHQRMTFFPANNSFGTYTKNGNYGYYACSDFKPHTFPGSTGKTEFTNTSTPAATLYNKNSDKTYYMNKPITDIKEQDGKISFTFMGGITAPVAEEATGSEGTAEIVDDSFTAHWQETDGADSYTIRLISYDVDAENHDATAVLSEDFNKCIGTYNSSTKQYTDGSLTISSKLDNYTRQSGWSGDYVYEGPGRIKMGSSSSQLSHLTTPVIDTPKSGTLTLKARLTQYNGASATMYVYLLSESGAKELHGDTLTLGTDTTEVTKLVYENVSQPTKIKFYCKAKKRAYVYDVKVFDEADGNEGQTTTFTPDTTIVEGIQGNSYTFTGLKAKGYYYQVRSQKGDNASEWSNTIKVVMPQGTGIEQIGLTGNDTLNTTDNRLFNLNGQQVNANASALKPGIYIKNGRKLLIK